MARKWNPQLQRWEREVGGQWVAAEEQVSAPQLSGGTALDTAIADAFGPDANGSTDSADLQLPEAFAQAADGVPPTDAGAQGGGVADLDGPVDSPGDGGRDRGIDAPSIVDDIPGLVSSDSPRSTRGAQNVRGRLQTLATRARKAPRTGQRVEVGPRAAKASGPAVKDGTAARQARPGAQRSSSGQVAPTGKAQRYTNRPTPGILAGRPRWVQDLFEAHFRSDMTLALRREHNRMKISRSDYAIGWLTLMDKLREDPSIARLKNAE